MLIEGPAKYQSDVRDRGSASFSLNDSVRCRDFSSLRALLKVSWVMQDQEGRKIIRLTVAVSSVEHHI